MIPIDDFINQLIQLGLAESFLEVIQKHYLKVTAIYNIISVIDTNNVKNMDCSVHDQDDSITLTVYLYNPIDDIVINDTNDLTVQINNDDSTVTVSVSNNYESEEEIYETRFNGHAKSNYRKWS